MFAFFIYILIGLFSILIFHGVWVVNTSIVEGLENNSTTTSEPNSSVDDMASYQPYNVNNPNNALILAQQNAGNIQVLKGEIIEFKGINSRVDEMRNNMNVMQQQIEDITNQQADYAQQLVGDTPPDIPGTDEVTANDVATSIEEEDKQ